MKRIRFIDRPVRVPRSFYEEAIEHIVKSNRNLPGLLSIHRFGNINVPGISDLDLLFVFSKGSHCRMNGLENLPEKFSPLFTHGIMAMCEDHFEDNFRYTIWSKAECVWGKQMPELRKRQEEEDRILSIQTAVEFLIANYIDFEVQSTYGIVKLRSFLQHIKGIAYDMELLGIHSSPIHPLLEQLQMMIVKWFEKTPSDHIISDWIKSFRTVFPVLLAQILENHPLILPGGDRYIIASNMLLIPDDKTGFTHKGWIPSPLFSFMGRKYFKLLHRLNRFLFTCPIVHAEEGFLADRFRFLQRMKSYNREHLPRFMTMTPSINAKII